MEQVQITVYNMTNYKNSRCIYASKISKNMDGY